MSKSSFHGTLSRTQFSISTIEVQATQKIKVQEDKRSLAVFQKAGMLTP